MVLSAYLRATDHWLMKATSATGTHAAITSPRSLTSLKAWSGSEKRGRPVGTCTPTKTGEGGAVRGEEGRGEWAVCELQYQSTVQAAWTQCITPCHPMPQCRQPLRTVPRMARWCPEVTMNWASSVERMTTSSVEAVDRYLAGLDLGRSLRGKRRA